MDRMKLFKLLAYLKSVDFYHDTHDLEDECVERILMEYGIYDGFTEEELQELGKEIYKLAEKNEFREVMRLSVNAGDIGGLKMIEIL